MSVQIEKVGGGGESTNFDKLHYVCYEAAPRFLRDVFYKFWKELWKVEWEDGRICGKKLMDIKNVGSILRGGKNFQKKNVDAGESLLWDLTLLVDILTVLLKEYPRVIVSSCDLSAFSKDNLEWLKKIRNQIAHAGSIEMDRETFELLWTKICSILTSMGMEENQLKRPKVEEEANKSNPVISEETSEGTKQAEKLKEIGNKLFKEKSFSEAALAYTKGIEMEKVPIELLASLYSNRSIALLKLNDLEGSKDDAKSCITLRPNWFRGYFRLGQTYEKAKKYSKASLNFNMAIHMGDKSKETADHVDYCRLMEDKLKRSEHTDPDMLNAKDLTYNLNQGFVSNFLGNEQGRKFMEGKPLHLCQMGHCYYLGRGGVEQDYERAAEYFAKAASLGAAEGIYNLAIVTREGKGVQRNVPKGHQLLLEAAGKPPVVEHVKGSGIKTRNIGVMEACHALGNSYQNGYAVKIDLKAAEKWYLKAVELGSAMAANNLGCMFEVEDPSKGIDFFKVSAYLGSVRGMENGANLYHNLGRYGTAQEWYHYAMHKGSIELQALRERYVKSKAIEKAFNPERFRDQLEKDLRENKGNVAGLLQKIEVNQKGLLDITTEEGARKLMAAGGKGFGGIGGDLGYGEEKIGVIMRHRSFLKVIRTAKFQTRIHLPSALPAHLPTASGVDLIGLKEIFFKDMEGQKEDTVYEGRVIKLTVIEDAALGNPSIALVVEDANGDVSRMSVYNYPQRKQTHEEIGYGCQISVIYPHYRLCADGFRAIRVDDPQLIVKRVHLRNPNRCRYCGNPEGGSVPCRTCGRVTYCSKLCLKKDAKELQHSLICFKSLND